MSRENITKALADDIRHMLRRLARSVPGRKDQFAELERCTALKGFMGQVVFRLPCNARAGFCGLHSFTVLSDNSLT